MAKRKTTRKRRTTSRALSTGYRPKAKTVRRRKRKTGLMDSAKAPASAIMYGAGGGVAYAVAQPYLKSLNPLTKALVGFGSAFLVSYMWTPTAGTGIAGATAFDLARTQFGLGEDDSLTDNEFINANDLEEGEVFISESGKMYALSEAGDQIEFIGMAEESMLSELEGSGFGYN
jgi:hypothetical protein